MFGEEYHREKRDDDVAYAEQRVGKTELGFGENEEPADRTKNVTGNAEEDVAVGKYQ